jgi:hypothetical protein
LGGDWRLSCRQLHVDRGSFFHTVYRIQEKLGRAFAEVEPYALFPLDEYFSGLVRRDPNYVPSSLGPLRAKPPALLPLSA